MMRMRKCLMVARESNAPSSEGTELNIIGMWKPKGLQQLWFGMGTEDTLSTLELLEDVMLSKNVSGSAFLMALYVTLDSEI